MASQQLRNLFCTSVEGGQCNISHVPREIPDDPIGILESQCPGPNPVAHEPMPPAFTVSVAPLFVFESLTRALLLTLQHARHMTVTTAMEPTRPCSTSSLRPRPSKRRLLQKASAAGDLSLQRRLQTCWPWRGCIEDPIGWRVAW